jgi:predicted nucleic acid-binding protein
MVCLDTDILVAFLGGNADAIDTIRALEQTEVPLTSTSVTAYELFKGAQISSNPKYNTQLVKNLLNGLHILYLDDKASERAGNLYAELRREGKLIGEFDILIASICITNDETLVSNNKHLRRIKKLKLKRW